MVRKIPLYVDHSKDGLTDTKCGTCAMRLTSPSARFAPCAIVEQQISLLRGTCNYWIKGPASSPDKASGSKMTKETAGYVLRDKVVCSTCMHYGPNYCKLWQAKVRPGDCCIAWED